MAAQQIQPDPYSYEVDLTKPTKTNFTREARIALVEPKKQPELKVQKQILETEIKQQTKPKQVQ